jgi:LL-diaminopimelate aminotransferase
MKFSKKLDSVKGVMTVEMNALLTRLKQEGREVLNLGVGDPDFSPPESIRRVLREGVDRPDSHHYPSFYPLQPLKEAIAVWYHRRFRVDLDSRTEVLPLLGSTDGLFNIHLCLLDPGDIALIPDPCYPSYESAARLAGGVVERFPLLRGNGFLPDLEAIPAETAKKAKMIWVNYPNNPTGATAAPEFYRNLIAWAKTNDLAVVSDNAYSEVYFDDRPPVSFLEFPGAREVGVEIHSLSKSFNCCGWRIGMMAGNKDLVEALSRVKAHSDRGIFYPLQQAAIAALESPPDFMKERNRVFQERREVVVRGLEEMGLEVYRPKATFYVWARVPQGYSSREFCFQALEEANVWMLPGSNYGKCGEGYLRIAITRSVEVLSEAMHRLQKMAIRH